MNEMIIRFFIGGIVVSLFAMIGDVLRPESLLVYLGQRLRLLWSPSG
jgi:hypothetical protein